MSNREYNFFSTVECSQTTQERIDMANQEHLELLKRGSSAWNAWREQHEKVRPDLSEANLNRATLRGANLIQADLRGADLSEADFEQAEINSANLSEANLTRANLIQAGLCGTNLSDAQLRGAILRGATLWEANLTRANLSQANLWEADFEQADLRGADLSQANLFEANLSEANLTGAQLSGTDLIRADLSEAKLSGADLSGADLRLARLDQADLSEAKLSGANLEGATLVETNFTDAILTGCHIYGIAAWNVELTGATQDSLVITPEDEPEITVDNLKIAQFIYLLLNNQEIRDVIDTIAKKAILILGRFTPERKAILDGLRDHLRKLGYLPILLDFDKPTSRDITETISTLAHLSRFVIADLTDAKSIPQELQAIVPTLPSVPVQPLILTSQLEYGMFEHFRRFSWVLPVYRYNDEGTLLKSLQEKVIIPAEQKAKELEKR